MRPPLRDWLATRFLLPVVTLHFLSSWHVAEAALFNVTVDDDGLDSLTGSMIVYTPPNLWNSGQNCTGCVAHPDPNRAWNYTWSDGTFKPAENPNTTLNATFQFQGSALWVYCILAPSKPALSSDSDMTFFIDGEPVGSFVQPAINVPDYTPNALVYHNTSIPYGAHTFVLQNGHFGSTNPSLTMLDYLIYSHDDGKTSAPSPSSSASPSGSVKSSHKLAIIIPTVIVVVAVIALLVLGFVWWRRRQRNQRQVEALLHYDAPISHTAPVPPITERRRVVTSEKSGPGVVLQYRPVSTDYREPSGSNTPRTLEDAEPPSYHESVTR